MKKFLLCLIALSLLATPVAARPFHRPHHRPAPVVIHKHHRGGLGTPLLALSTGLIGFAIGASTAPQTQTVYYAPVEDKQCFAVVSKSSGNITQQCVSGSNQVLYVD